MTAARLALDLLRPAAALAGAALVAAAVIVVVVVVAVHRCHQPFPPEATLVPLAEVPPDACLALFGPGPCRPHGGMPTTGWTDAVAGPAPADVRPRR